MEAWRVALYSGGSTGPDPALARIRSGDVRDVGHKWGCGLALRTVIEKGALAPFSLLAFAAPGRAASHTDVGAAAYGLLDEKRQQAVRALLPTLIWFVSNDSIRGCPPTQATMNVACVS